jgi:Transcriptional regulator/sugar kinase
MGKNLNFKRTASSELQFLVNTSIVFNYLYSKSLISRAEISRDLNISAPAVSRAINKLIKKSYVVEKEKANTKLGKKPILLDINKNNGFVIGVDLGKENIEIALSNLKNEIILKRKGAVISNNKDIVEKLIEEIKNLIKATEGIKDFNQKKLKAICVGIPAFIDINSGKIIGAPLYEKWKNINFKEILSKEFKLPVFVENDVNLSALGEKNYGNAKDCRNIVFIEISRGLGSGIIIDNKLFRGTNGSAGEIGLSIVTGDIDKLKNKKRILLEQYVTVDSIKKEVINRINKGEQSVITNIINNSIQEVEIKHVFQAAAAGDKLCLEIINNTVEFLSISIVNLILTLDPQIIVIGGEISNQIKIHDLFLDPIIKKINKSLALNIPKIILSKLGEEAGIIGATFHGVNLILMEEFPYDINIV